KNKIKRTHNKAPNLSDVYKTKKDIPSLDFVKDDYDKYVKEYNQGYGKFHQNKKFPAIINTARGCRNYSNKCIYCSIYDLKPKWVSADFFWKVIQKYHNDYGINLFYEVADEFLTFQSFIKDIIKNKPFDLREKDIELMIYARADDIVSIPEAIKWLKELNVVRVNLGLDSGDNKILKLLRKNLKANNLKPTEINYQAVKLLAENNITVHASFPVGCIGETKTSLKNTLNFVKKIARDFPKHIAALEVSELVPIPNSAVWDMLLGKKKSIYYDSLYSELKKANIQVSISKLKKLNKKYNNNDIVDIKKSSKDWIKYFTHIDWADVERMEKKIIQIAKKLKIAYGRAI
ncbi:radical SAM protein, partial [Patescibacteria group bacterium]|nr:radical SAM protein [Patescibacteria group bacterium]